MENCLNIKRYLRHKLCIWGLCLFLPALLHQKRAAAQPFFNRLYTNNASGSVFMSVCPQGKEGGFMAVAMAKDSITNGQGMRISRFDKDGILKNSGFYNLSDYPDRELYASKSALCKVNDNCFGIAGIVLKPGIAQSGFVALTDSNGNVYKYVDITRPCSLPDSFMYTSDVKFDGTNVIVLNHIQCGKTPNVLYQMINKYDTALNLLWSKTYNEGHYDIRIAYSLYVDSTGYVASGVNQQNIYESKNFKSSAFVFRTDTAGMVQWRWNSPTMMSAAAHIVRTLDGAYVFAAMGNVYDRDSAHPTWSAYWHAQEILVKLSSEGNFLWQKLYSPKYFPNLGINDSRLLPTNDSGFKTLRGWTDSPFVFGDSLFARISTFNKDGELLKNRRFPIPTVMPMKGGTALNDFIFTSDKSMLACGYYESYLSTATAPAQRGWLLKTDSNGCMGADDPQCDPAGIITPFVAKNDFLIYPNPAGAEFFIQHNIAGKEKISLNIYDINGRIITTIPIIQQSAPQVIPSAQWPSGVYLYRLMQGEQTLYYGKLLKY